VIRRSLRIKNPLGLHARAAARFVHTAGRFRSRVSATRDGRRMDGKSILGILLLGASQGTEIEVEVEGPDEADALKALEALVADGFGERGA
jgi:phosphocarrier protein